MATKICKKCGKTFEGKSNSAAYCAECTAPDPARFKRIEVPHVGEILLRKSNGESAEDIAEAISLPLEDVQIALSLGSLDLSAGSVRKCRICGKLLLSDDKKTLCPDCVAAQKKENVRTCTCRECRSEFLGGPRAIYCPRCRAERQAKQAAECAKRRKAGKAREIGSTDLCLICGEPYIINGGLQKYCKACAKEAIKANDRKRGLEYYYEVGANSRRKDLREQSAPQKYCLFCGKEFVQKGAKRYCSEDCRKAALIGRQRAFEQAHKQDRSARLKAPPEERICPQCRKVFVVSGHALAKKKFCSRSCLDKFHNAKKQKQQP